MRPNAITYSISPVGGSPYTLYATAPVYDAVGNVAGVTTSLPNGVDTQVFCYDERDRLTWAGSSGTPPCSSSLTPGSFSGASYAASYTYDAANRLRSAPLGAYSYTDNNHVDAVTAIGGTAWTGSYDGAGDLTCRAPSSATTCAGTPTGAKLSYDNAGQLSGWQNAQSNPTTTASYLYDGEGHRVQQVVTASGTTTTTTYVGGLEELATTGSTTTTTAYYGGLATSVNGTLSYILRDGLGSVSAGASPGL